MGYQPLGPIAAGSFSTILKARGSDGMIVAVKTFDEYKGRREPTIANATMRELTVLRRLRDVATEQGCRPGHPNVANMLEELGEGHESSDSRFVHAVLEYCEGGSLQRYIANVRKRAPTCPGERAGLANGLAARLAALLASAVEHLHGLRICHRDIKPANILLTGKDKTGAPSSLKLCDFGFACVMADCHGLGGDGEASNSSRLRDPIGTPAYLAPEMNAQVVQTAGYFGDQVDMWAYGCVVYELLHGQYAFHATSKEQLDQRIRACGHQPIHASVPPTARALIKELLVASAGKRLTAKQALANLWLQNALPPPLASQPSETCVGEQLATGEVLVNDDDLYGA